MCGRVGGGRNVGSVDDGIGWVLGGGFHCPWERVIVGVRCGNGSWRSGDFQVRFLECGLSAKSSGQ